MLVYWIASAKTVIINNIGRFKENVGQTVGEILGHLEDVVAKRDVVLATDNVILRKNSRTELD